MGSLAKAGMGSAFPRSVTIGARTRKMQIMAIAIMEIAIAITIAENKWI